MKLVENLDGSSQTRVCGKQSSRDWRQEYSRQVFEQSNHSALISLEGKEGKSLISWSLLIIVLASSAEALLHHLRWSIQVKDHSVKEFYGEGSYNEASLIMAFYNQKVWMKPCIMKPFNENWVICHETIGHDHVMTGWLSQCRTTITPPDQRPTGWYQQW